MKKALLLLLVLFSLPISVAYPQDYIVGEGDVLKIEVYGHPDLTTTVRVSGEGAIIFPLIGQVEVSGKTIPLIAEKISGMLSKGYIIDPQVNIFIQEFRSQKATIMGQVNRPGLYVMNGRTNFLQLLSFAGGVTNEAGEKAIVKRKSGAESEEENVLTVDLKKLLQEGDTSQNIEIHDNDSIYVMKAGIFYITGEVNKPSSYKFEEGMTVVKAATLAGGFTDKAADGRIRIIRKVDGKETVIKNVGMDEFIQPDDVIVVPESFF